MFPEQLVIIGALLNVVGTTGYFIATLKGKVKPNRVSWFIWALSSLIAFAAQVHQGIGLQALLTFSVGFCPLLVFIATFFNKKAIWKLERLDYICGAFALLGILLWMLTSIGNIAILFSIIADIFASIPTIMKSYKAPETENRLTYLLSGISGLLTMLTIKNWNFATYSYPVYIFLINLVIWFVLFIRRGKAS